MGEGSLVQKVPFLGLHGWVADHSCSTSDQRIRLMAALLEMLQDHDAHKVSDVKGVSRRVDSYVCSLRAFHELFFGSGHDVLDHPSPL